MPRKAMGEIIPQGQYQMFRDHTKAWIQKAWKTSQDTAELTKIQSFKQKTLFY